LFFLEGVVGNVGSGVVGGGVTGVGGGVVVGGVIALNDSLSEISLEFLQDDNVNRRKIENNKQRLLYLI